MMPGITMMQRAKRRQSWAPVPDVLTIAASGGTMNSAASSAGFTSTSDSSGAWDGNNLTCSTDPLGFRAGFSQSYARYTTAFRPNQVRIRRGYPAGHRGTHIISFYGMLGATGYDDNGFVFMADIILPAAMVAVSDWTDISPNANFDSWKFVAKSNNGSGPHFWIADVEFRVNSDP